MVRAAMMPGGPEQRPGRIPIRLLRKKIEEARCQGIWMGALAASVVTLALCWLTR